MPKLKRERVKPKVKSFNCGNCGATVEIKILGQTLNVVCKSCKAIIDANDPNYKVLQKFIKKRKYRPYIPLNSRGKLKGVLWECVGFTVKSDSGYYWREYLLFNPYNGYRWLVEVDGHWGLYKKIYHYHDENHYAMKTTYKKKDFRLFNYGKAKVKYVEGEFFWRIKRGDVTKMKDFIAPPNGLSAEFTDKEVNWTFGYHIDAHTIQNAFKIKDLPPYQSGVGQLQPSPHKENFRKKMKPMFLALIAAVSIFVYRETTAKNKFIMGFDLQHDQSDKLANKTYKTDNFKIEGRTSNVNLAAHSQLYNAWIYIDALLVDVDTGKGIPMPIELSYYYGSDWSEGSRYGSRVFNNIPPGEYYFSIQSQSGRTNYLSKQKTKYSVQLYRDAPIRSNFVIVFILIVIGPLFSFLRKRGFEVSRWSNSDYSPYSQD